MDLQLKGKVAVITGGAKGIGKGIAECLAGEGVNVVINYRSDPENAAKVEKDFTEKYANLSYTFGEILSWTLMWAFFATFTNYFLGMLVAILINNAGLGCPNGDFETVNYDDWQYGIDNNVNGQFRTCQKYVKYWKQNKMEGHIVNVLSKSCFMTNSIRNQAYASAKGGLTALTRSLANEVIHYGIYVNGIIPGYVQTERAHAPGTERYNRMISKLPTGKFGTPADMGAVATFLCSPLANQVIGACIDCTGGTLL